MEEMVIVNNVPETRFQAALGGHLALLDYRISDGVFSIDYVFVPPDYRGRGFGGQLIEAALAYARTEGLRVNPICSYARAYLARKAE